MMTITSVWASASFVLSVNNQEWSFISQNNDIRYAEGHKMNAFFGSLRSIDIFLQKQFCRILFYSIAIF